MVEVPVFAIVAPRLIVEPATILLRADGTQAGTRRRISIKTTDASPLRVLHAESQSPAVTMTVEEPSREKSSHVAFLRAGRPPMGKEEFAASARAVAAGAVAPRIEGRGEILELQVGEGFRSIFDVQYTDGPRTAGPADAQPANPLLPSALTAPRNVLGSGNFAVEPGTFVYQFLNDTVRARLQLLATERRVNTLATPLLLASNNRPASACAGSTPGASATLTCARRPGTRRSSSLSRRSSTRWPGATLSGPRA